MLQRGKQAEGEGGEGLPEPQSGSELGLEICSRLPLLCSGHSSLQTLNLCISWGLLPVPSWQLHRAQTTTACHPASPGLHEPSARSLSQPSATRFSKHHHACTTQTGQLHLVPSPSTKLGETIPLFSPRLWATPPPRSPAPRRHSPGLATPHAGGMPVGYWWNGWGTQMSTPLEGDGLRGQSWSCSGDEMGGSSGRQGEESAFLPANPQKAGLTSKEGAHPVRLCRKWQSPGRHPPGEDTRDYAPRRLPVGPERAGLDRGTTDPGTALGRARWEGEEDAEVTASAGRGPASG